ncbi:hypothetical protein N1031_10685 [Herbiconiux moechotypicola]|uniref:Uncharacterized protein n=1 Tax=Herbiconiux moechotypicola TaxID=637393 RepID=A0ABN3DMN6_9MICO|nr:hypothetical protein [Herbiconiux moechotypicola]MCS5730226.1 hypothetical protein [Herbiconiux moechotypicola]
MKQITYAGDSVLTTDDVGSALVELTACLARKGLAEAVSIPILLEGEVRDAELVIGVGNDVLSIPIDFDGDGPDFSVAADRLRSQMEAHTADRVVRPTALDDSFDDFFDV